MDQQVLESLLWQPEGTALDFKQCQYPFVHASDRDKSELLKDILAMANSWRSGTAHILIGVEEVKGGRGIIQGVNVHLEDADLHQFVNCKTQRPVDFSYIQFHAEGRDIAIIEIPKQARPVFLLKKYGKLDANEVRVKDGSSTRIANPDEISRMATADALGGSPQIKMNWFNIGLGSDLGTSVSWNSSSLNAPT